MALVADAFAQGRLEARRIDDRIIPFRWIGGPVPGDVILPGAVTTLAANHGLENG